MNIFESKWAKRTLFLVGVSSVSMTGIAPVFAQEGASETTGIQEIIVTAQRREQKLQDVPTTVGVLTQDALQAANVVEVNQLSNVTPGILINSDQTGRNTQIKIRGIGPDESSNIRPSIAFFYNDIPLMTQVAGGQSVASDLDLGDLTRVEVLKGPQSTLFGESVSGGAISFYNNRPKVSDGYNGKLSATYGSNNSFQARGSIGAPIGDSVAIRFSAYHNEYDGQVLNTVDGSRKQFEGNGFNAQILITPHPDVDINLEHNYRSSKYHGGSSDEKEVLSYGQTAIDSARTQGVTLTPADPFDRKVQIRYPMREKFVNSLTSMHVNWRITNDWSLTSITAHQRNKDRYTGDGPLGGYNASDSITPGFLAKGSHRIRYTTQELRLAYNSENFNSLIGAFYSDYDVPLASGDFFFQAYSLPMELIQTVDRQTWSIFTHNSYKFSSAFEVVVGARYTKEKAKGINEILYGSGAYAGGSPALNTLPIRRSNESAWGGTAKALYHIDRDITIYAGVDRGFRLGGINNLGQPNYGTETAYNYEIGLKSYLFDRQLRLNMALYRTDYNGYQVVSYDSRSLSFITQNADVKVKGVELDALWEPVTGLSLTLAANYNDAKYKKYIGAICDNYQVANGFCPNFPVAGAQDLSGRRLGQAPRWSLNSTVHYEWQLGSGDLTGFVDGSYAYRGSANAHPVGVNGDPKQKIPAYGIFNANLGLRSLAGWQVSVWGKNLANKNYFTFISRQPVGEDADYMVARVGMERTIGVTLGYSF